MQIEYEATFIKVNKNAVRASLKRAGALLVKKEFLQKRYCFDLPPGHEIENGWLRVRDEGDKITMSLKVNNASKITGQKEICLSVDNIKKAREILSMLGCPLKAYQESKRELWRLAGVEITLDTWPFLEPFVEVEGGSEKAVKAVAKKLGFAYKKALFCSITTLYRLKYNLPDKVINSETPRIVFGEKNPFLNKKFY